ncbi:MAG: tRNA 2-selenouridine(34) synthase MnmH [Spirochaetales bacterium]|nr:MAG: tRNA 2-selenouridine(34) synthase MnmH [Spirochaetales bacterium]
MREISYEEARSLRAAVFVDVRAPVEYFADHIPGSINVPIFDDEERALVGALYRTHGQEVAIVKGTEIAGSKLAGMVERLSNIKGRDIVIACFRGGMRSSTLASLLESLGIPVLKLKGGYREYRRYVRGRIDSLEPAVPLFVLHGLAGTGKTRIIRKIGNSIDLEAMAGHRSSVFGALGLSPSSQKMFESLLVERIDSLGGHPYAIIEGESRKIGDVHMPSRLLERMRRSSGILVRASMERRVQNILAEYPRDADPGSVRNIVRSLANRIGSRAAGTLVDLFERGEFEDFTALLLEKYYDPLYAHSLERMSFIAEVDAGDVDEAARCVVETVRKRI